MQGRQFLDCTSSSLFASYVSFPVNCILDIALYYGDVTGIFHGKDWDMDTCMKLQEVWSSGYESRITKLDLNSAMF